MIDKKVKLNDKLIRKFKETKGSITLFVLVSALFFTIVTTGAYISSNSKVQQEEKEIEKIQQEYNKVEINDIYQETYNEYINTATPTIQVYAGAVFKGEAKGQDKNSLKILYSDQEEVTLKLLSSNNNNSYVYSNTRDGEKFDVNNNEIKTKISTEGKTVYVYIKDIDGNVSKYYTAVTIKLTILEDKTIYIAEGNSTKITDIKGENLGNITYGELQDKSIISLNDDTITGLKAGTTTLKATESNGGATATVTIKVTNVVLAKIIGTTNIGENKKIDISGTNYGTLTATSTDNTIATASINGTTLVITPVKVGDTTITVTEANAGATANYKIKVVKITLAPNGGQYTMPTSGKATIKSTVNVDNIGSEDKIETAWTSEKVEWKTINNNTEVSKTDCIEGTYYLYVKINSEYTYQSSAFIVGENTLTENIIKLTPNTTSWTNQNVKVTASYGSTLTQNKTLTCTGTSGTNYTVDGTTSVTVITNNKTITATAKDAAGNQITKTLTIANIDKELPTVTLSPNGGNYTIPQGNSTIAISTKLTATDTGGSNLNTLQYAWSRSNTSEPSTWTTFTNNGTIKANTNGTWYMWTKVTDGATNRATNIKVSNAFITNCQVNYNANEGAGAPGSQTVLYGTTMTINSSVPTRTGYTFQGWSTNANSSTAEYQVGGTINVTSSFTLYAVWKINSYSIDLNMTVDGIAYNAGYNGKITIGLKIGGTDKGYVTDYCQASNYGTSYEIYEVKLDGISVAYSKTGTLGAGTLDLRVYFNTISFTANSGTYGSVSTSNYIVLSGTTYSTSSNTLTLSDGRKVTASTKSVTGYMSTFNGWSPTSGTINSATSVTASFSGVDNIAPSVELKSNTTTPTNKIAYLTTTANDSGSGICDYTFYYKNGDTTKNDGSTSGATTNNDGTFECKTKFGYTEVYVIVKDNAGNTKKSNTITIKDFCIIEELELQAFRDGINNDSSNSKFNTATIVQSADITLTSTWSEPIGNNDTHKFIGKYDGGNKKISKLRLDTTKNAIGLFGYNSGTVQNVNLINSYTKGNTYVGGIVGYNTGNINNCKLSYETIPGFSSSTGVTGMINVGGIVGYSSGNIENCQVNAGMILSTGSPDSTNLRKIGGICGLLVEGSTGSIKNCTNNVTVNNISGKGTGGIVGVIQKSGTGCRTIESCSNTGNVISSSELTGGICGAAAGLDTNNELLITKCKNTGAVTGGFDVGGIAGKLATAGYVRINECYNTGIIKATDYSSGLATAAGGIAGFTSDHNYIQYSYNTASVQGTSSSGSTNIGGITGALATNSTITSCYNIGSVSITKSITNDYYVGGLVGKNANGDNLNNISNSYSIYNANTGNKYLVGTATGGYSEPKYNTNINAKPDGTYITADNLGSTYYYQSSSTDNHPKLRNNPE